MSNDPNFFANVDNLTPFEYALAGVETPEAQDSPSLGVIQQMRRLAAEVDDAPVTHAGLNEILRTGAVTSARRSGRPSFRKRRPTTAADAVAIVSDAGGFVDITPIELAEDEPAAPSTENDESIAAAAAVGGAAAILNLDDPTDELTRDQFGDMEVPTSEFDASDIDLDSDLELDSDVELNGGIELDRDGELDSDVESVDIEDLEDYDDLQGYEELEDIVPEPPTMPEPVAETKPAELKSLDEAIVQAQALLAGDEDVQADIDEDETTEHSVEQGEIEDLIDEVTASPDSISYEDADTAELLERDQSLIAAELNDDVDMFEDDADDEVAAVADQDETVVIKNAGDIQMPVFPSASETVNIDDHPDLQPSMFPGVPDDEELLLADSELAAEDPIGSDDDRGTKGAVLVGASAASLAGILGRTGEIYTEPAAADPIDAFDGPAKPERRRIGGAFWALAGTAAATSILVLGGLWWASGLRDSNETDAAAAPTSLGDALAPEPGSVEAGSSSDDADGEPASAGESSDEDLPSETGAFGEDSDEPGRSTGSNTSVPPTTAATDSDQTAPAATEPVTDTTAAAVETTVPETTEPEVETTVELTTTTEQPQVTEPEPTATTATIPPTTEAALGFIGDSVNIGSFSGPGASGVQVEIFADTNNDGQPEQRVGGTNTNANGRYSFNVPGACYVVRFSVPAGFDLDPSMASQAVCVPAGGARGRIDAVLTEKVAAVRPPDGCTVEDSSNRLQGVEVYENGGDWADFYVFLGQNGNVVYRTPNQPHDIDGSDNDDYEWVGDIGGFNVRDVWSVAANRGGTRSAAVGCFRE